MAITDRNQFFTELLKILEPGGVTSDVSYYTDNKAGEVEWKNLISKVFERTEPGSPERAKFIDTLKEGGFFKASDNLDFWKNEATSENTLDVADLENAAVERFPTLMVDQGGGVKVKQGGPNEAPSKDGVGGKAPSTVSILTSKSMKWYFDPSTGKWMVSYKLPNSNRNIFFEARGSQLDAIFGEGMRPTNYESVSFKDLSQREGYTFGQDIMEVYGTGSFEGRVEQVISRALDEGVLPKWAKSDPKATDLLFIAASEKKSQDWLIEQLSKLQSFKQRFPGIESFQSLGMSLKDSVEGFLQLEEGVKKIVLRDGGNPDAVTPDTIGGLVAKGHSLTDVEFTYKIFDTMEKNAGALAAFNEILAAQGKNPLTEDDQFDFLSGKAPKELYDTWENASLLRAAEDAGLNITVSGAIDLAARTEGLTSYDTALEGLTSAASSLLRFRTEIDLGRYGINQDDLVDLSLGLAPASGTPQADIARNIERAIGAAKAQREKALANPFTGYTQEGTPQQTSLSRTRQEG